MLTQCPRCDTIYRLAAADLGSAGGFVECGECGEQFDALLRLADEPKFSGEAGPATGPGSATRDTQATRTTTGPTAPAPAVSYGTRDQHEAGVERRVADGRADTRPVAGVPDGIAPAGASADDNAHDNTMFLAPAPAATSTLGESEHAILFNDPVDEPGRTRDEERDAIDLDDVPAVIKSEFVALTQARQRPLRWQWWALTIILLLLLTLQGSWVFRDEIRTAVPATAPLYSEICTRLGCRPDRPRPVAFELLARDVRDHPQYRDTLLVNATLVSRSPTAVPFPAIQLGLRGATGQIIGIRRFEPREYLDKSIDINSGMPPNRPVYIVMEVAEVAGGAMSFEFVFL